MKSATLSLILAIAILINSCSSCKKETTPTNDNPWGLPNATQEGKNTLGFLLNGQPWTPEGFNGTTNLSLYYDEAFDGGVFNISCYKTISNSKEQKLIMFGDSVQNAKKIMLPNKKLFGTTFYNDVTGCEYVSSDTSVKIITGFFDLQKLDKINRIFSGQFEFTIIKMGCDTVKITNGRFDFSYY